MPEIGWEFIKSATGRSDVPEEQYLASWVSFTARCARELGDKKGDFDPRESHTSGQPLRGALKLPMLDWKLRAFAPGRGLSLSKRGGQKLQRGKDPAGKKQREEGPLTRKSGKKSPLTPTGPRHSATV